MAGSPVVFLLAAVWLAIALIPLRSPAARRGLAAFVLGVSALAVIAIGILARQAEENPAHQSDAMWSAMLVVGVLVAPAAIAALVRRARVGGVS